MSHSNQFFENETEWKAAIAELTNASKADFPELRTIIRRLGELPEHTHQQDALFLLSQVGEKIDIYKESLRLRANKMKLESFKREHIKDYSV